MSASNSFGVPLNSFLVGQKSAPLRTAESQKAHDLAAVRITKAANLALELMLEELEGPAGKTIAEHVHLKTKACLLEFNSKRADPPYVVCNKSQFLSFLDVWLDLLKENLHQQALANKYFCEWLCGGFSEVVSDPANLLAWNEGILQGYIDRFHSKELLKNIDLRETELNDKLDAQFSCTSDVAVCFLSLSLGNIMMTHYVPLGAPGPGPFGPCGPPWQRVEAVRSEAQAPADHSKDMKMRTVRAVSFASFGALARRFFVSGIAADHVVFRPEGLCVPANQVARELSFTSAPRVVNGVDGVWRVLSRADDRRTRKNIKITAARRAAISVFSALPDCIPESLVLPPPGWKSGTKA